MIRELRLVVTADDYDEAVAFYRDVLGMLLLEAGKATLEISDVKNSAWVDEVEVGRTIGSHIRVALEVDDARAVTKAAVEAGAEVVAEPTETPWQSLNSRLEGPGDLQLTLFEELVKKPTAWS
jgi:lactoylglutathione lyase